MADKPADDRKRQPRLAGPMRLVRHVGVYLALLAGAALVLGGVSLAAQAFGFDPDASRFGRFFILAVYVIGAVAALTKLGG